MRVRDNQRQRLYDAEHSVLDGHGPQNMTIQQCQAYVDKVLQSAFVQSRWGRVHLTVVATHGGGRLVGGTIRLGTWARQPSVILHEITHTLVPEHKYAAHGPEFAACYLLLVNRFLGAVQGAKLRESYRKHRVKYRTGMAALPASGTRTVITQGQRQARKRAAAAIPLSRDEREQAARYLRRAIAAGVFGEPGRKPRAHAQAVARTLEGPAS